MIARSLLCLALCAPVALFATTPPRPQPAASYVEDFDLAWRTLDTRYAYRDKARAPSRRARDAWRARAQRARSAAELAAALEGAIAQLHDDHVSLSPRDAHGARRVPAESDIWAAWKEGAARVESVRTFGDADVAGLKPGHVVERIGGAPAESAVRGLLGEGAAISAESRDWALRHALAGPRQGVLRLDVREGSATRALEIERKEHPGANGPLLIGRRMGDERDLGYIRIKQGLGDARLVEQFDGALNYLKDTRALILDLREVSGDGNRNVTRAILARFVVAESPWQLREGPAGKRIADTIAPRGEPYRRPLLVLVDRWTAGEGEALAAGLAAAAGARLVGTPMAGLRGELAALKLPRSGIVLRYPAEKVFHVDGTPRESLRPHMAVDLAAPQGGPGDPILYQALKILEKR
jgi:C-terminal processing protease CtpA/Prc